MDEIRSAPEEGIESGEARDAELQTLNDATLNPRAYIEQTGDYQQAEAIQTTLANITENASRAAGNEGATPLPIPQPVNDSVVGSRPAARDDLDQVTVVEDNDRHEATPIPLPGPQGASATPITLPNVMAQAEEEEGHPPEPPDLDHSPLPQQVMDTSGSDSIRGQMPRMRDDLDQATVGVDDDPHDATPINLPGPQEGRIGSQPVWGGDKSAELSDAAQTPERPRQEANFEKPILHQELEDLDSGLEGLDDLEGLIPGPGKIGGNSGEGQPGDDILGGLPGFEGGPGDLKNNLGGPHDEPPPGGFPSRGEMKGIEGKGTNIFWSWNFVPGNESRYTHSKEMTEGPTDDEPLEYDPNWEAVPKGQTIDPFEETIAPAVPADYEEHEAEMTRFTKAQKEFGEEKRGEDIAATIWKFLGLMEPDEGGAKGGLAAEQVNAPNPKYDSGQISNYPEDHIAGNQGGGMVSEEHAEMIKRSLEKDGKIAGTHPKAGAEQITDPPEHDPGKKSETSGKSS
ncbi:MAG: hypothetical protein JXB85_08675 [Anaerolineales bacterium]|nr:hypothetical protein [Anaerolineales bacterium]